MTDPTEPGPRLRLDDPVTAVPGVTGKLAADLKRAFGVRTVHDLLEHHPRRHHDAGAVLDLADVEVGEPATLIGTITSWSTRRIPKRGRTLDLAVATVVQSSGSRFEVTFFNQRFRTRQLPEGTVGAFSAKVDAFRGTPKLTNPDVHVLGQVRAGVALGHAIDPADFDHQRLLPVYPAVKGLPSIRLVPVVEAALEHLPTIDDWLPPGWLDELDLLTLDDALRGHHLPPDRATADAARRRLTFDELFALQLGLQWRRARLEADTVGQDNAPVGGDGWAARFLGALPFPPTGAQTRAFDEVGADLASARPMHRLLQGDVGSGKTVVAVWSLLGALDHGRQAALMVPTEVLAEQHHRTLTELLAPLGVNVLDGIRVELLTGSSTVTHRRRVLGELLSGEVDLVVGTHALLEEGVRFRDLGVVVIDEQHRFGVSQRVQLKDKASTTGDRDVMPDVLVMTATPIPRSLALTLYGDLDVTVLDELPPGREPIRTALITPAEAHRREALYGFVRREVAEGRRAYVVCPLVEEGEVEATNVTDHHHHLATEVFPELTVELVHGRMRPDAKEAAMGRFRTGQAQVLVSTTVIEVGVDVPEATVMIIEDAERFGISQLHQLRGRVGRGGGTSYCVLFAGWRGELTDDALRRLRAVEATTDGFALSETDLDVRGAGQLFGKAQSGLPDLKLAHLQRDQGLIQLARDRARAVVAADPDLAAPEHAALRAEVLRRYEGGLEQFAALQTG